MENYIKRFRGIQLNGYKGRTLRNQFQLSIREVFMGAMKVFKFNGTPQRILTHMKT